MLAEAPTREKCAETKSSVPHFNLPIDKIEFIVADKPVQQLIKRGLDIVLSLTALVVLSPVLALLAILIKLESKGPALFKQERIGLNQKRFNMYKFRSMVIDAEERFEQVKKLNTTNDIMFKSKDDPRITRVGKFIRKYSLDEVPQLFNILRGDMTLVGPRPPLARELSKYKDWHYVRFTRTPGLTGLWQISGRADIQCFDEVVNLDYKYISNWNLLLDFKIILKTIPVVILAKGAG